MATAPVSVSGDFSACDVVLDYFVDYSYESFSLMSILLEAKKTIVMQYGLRLCENTFYGLSPRAGVSPKLYVNGLEVPDPHLLSSDELTMIIIELYEEGERAYNLAHIPSAHDESPSFGSGALIAG